MLLIVIFFGKNNMIREEFVSFLECKDGSIGVGFYQTIRKFLGSKGFKIKAWKKYFTLAGHVVLFNNTITILTFLFEFIVSLTHCF